MPHKAGYERARGAVAVKILRVQPTVVTPAAATRPGRFRAWQVAVVLVLAALVI